VAAENSYDSPKSVLHCEYLYLNVAYRYLLSPVFQAKKDACDFLNDFFGRITDINSNRKIHDLNPHLFFDWLQHKKVLEYLLNDTAHIEIFKRAADLLKMLCKNRLLNE